jgi:hypothetical protein
MAVLAAACAGTRIPASLATGGLVPASGHTIARQSAEVASRYWPGPSLVAPAPQVTEATPARAALQKRQAPTLDAAALRRAQRYVGTRGPWSHLCLRFVRKVYQLPARDRSAIAAWRAADSRHKGDALPPAGVPVFWSGGGPGHVALSLGDGWVLTSDYPTSGRVTRVPISTIDAAWGLHYLGWTDDLEGVTIHR